MQHLHGETFALMRNFRSCWLQLKWLDFTLKMSLVVKVVFAHKMKIIHTEWNTVINKPGFKNQLQFLHTKHNVWNAVWTCLHWVHPLIFWSVTENLESFHYFLFSSFQFALFSILNSLWLCISKVVCTVCAFVCMSIKYMCIWWTHDSLRSMLLISQSVSCRWNHRLYCHRPDFMLRWTSEVVQLSQQH